MAEWYRCEGKIITLSLHIQPGAKRNEIVGLHGDALKIKLSAPPVEGCANEALLKFIARIFDVPLRQVEIRQGRQSRRKVVLVQGSHVSPEHITRIAGG